MCMHAMALHHNVIRKAAKKVATTYDSNQEKAIVSFVSFQQSPHWQWQQQGTLVEAMGQHGVCMEALFIPLLLVGGTGKLQIKIANCKQNSANETAAEIFSSMRIHDHRSIISRMKIQIKKLSVP